MRAKRPRRVRGGGRLTLPQSVPAPNLGWNTRDPFAAMDPQDAITLDNWTADYGGVRIRMGSISFAKVGDGSVPVETLAVLESTAVVGTMLAACGGTIYNVTLGSTTGMVVGSGFISNRWQNAVFQNRLFLVNGADPMQVYDGGSLSAAAFTGTLTSTLYGVTVVHNRLFFWTGEDASFWYGPVNGIAGALNEFNLATVAANGGSLIAVDVLSYDGGTGIDSYTCFFMSSGELLMYTGTDPTNQSNWALVGRYMLPPAISPRAIARYGGDIYITTHNDHLQLSQILIALKLGQTPPRSKISGAVTSAINAGQSLFGWQAIYFPMATRIIFNIPNADGTFDQHVYNTSLQSWSRFKGLNAHCWAILNDNIYFGKSGGEIIQAAVGFTDSDADGTRPIIASSQQAWQNFGTPLRKRLAASRIVVETNNSGASYSFDVGIDYGPVTFVTPITTTPLGPLWGSVTWGAFTWGQALPIVDTDWHIEGGEGAAFSWGVVANSRASTTWVRTDLLLEPGVAL